MYETVVWFCTVVHPAHLARRDLRPKSTVSTKTVPAYSKSLNLNNEKLKFSVPFEYLNAKGLDPEIKAKMLELIQWLKDQGHSVKEINFPYLKYLVPNYYVLSTAEASSNLARYDGVHYGKRSEKVEDIDSTLSIQPEERP